MGKKCLYEDRSGRRCNHQNYDLSSYCYWHDPKAKKNKSDTKEKLIALYKAGESFEGFQLKDADLSDLDFSGANFSYCNLEQVNFTGTNLYGCNFSYSSMQNSHLNQANLNQAQCILTDLSGIELEGAQIERVDWGDIIFQEKTALDYYRSGKYDLAAQCFIRAEEVYRFLYKACENKGLYDEASTFYHRDRIMRRYQLPFFSKEWVISYLVDLLCGYGERPLRVVSFSIWVIMIWAIFYSVIGLHYQDSSLQIGINSSLPENLYVLSHSLYFSVVTFTTLGYGDIIPMGFAKLLAATEAFIGSFTIAVFVVVFVKKMTR